ncbi:probable E3 ubiquitin-protein ligase HERC4 isoform X2 [Malaya genurostris]|uniref:probable E3 ubiquitin-protein ligase HERC4 isoform X2 n=1 Tax=Malaya genurostris TaxID=325434 RepID=UPI0026F388FA|nr:probable E3 ubiquitin-protein ligase HERC4 isoform X2 [Malaya genurostris]
MAVYCWGNTAHGELGLGGIEEEQVMLPREMNWSHADGVKQTACGGSHTLLLTKDGKLFACGNNDLGQLGHLTNDVPNKRPQFVSSLENYIITHISCGTAHSLAITNWGQLFTWGSNALGQLGHDLENSSYATPRMVKAIATKSVIQVAAGQMHSLALTNNGELYAWGANGHGQLGLGTTNEKILVPTLVKSLAGIPIAFIACGGYHSFAVSKSGAIFGWGKNTFGQLGLNDLNSRCYPTQLKTLRSLGVKYISCGDDFSVFLTQEGGVFTCGAGTFGQLGHGTYSNEILPRMVFELMGSKITQIACGRRHTLAFVPSRGKIYGFGLGGVGQLGVGGNSNFNTPQIVRGPWIDSFSDLNLRASLPSPTQQLIVGKIFSGGDQCFVSLLTEACLDEHSADYRLYAIGTQICSLSVDDSRKLAIIQPEETVDMDLITLVETVFKSLACFNASWLLPEDKHFCCTSKHPGVDVDAAEAAFEYIRKIEHDTLKQLIWEAVSTDLINSLMPSPADVETLRVYLTLPMYHEFINSKNYLKLHSPFSQAFQNLQKIPHKIVSLWWSNQTREYFERLVDNFKSVILYIIHFKFPKVVGCEEKQEIRYEPNLVSMLNILAILYKINHFERSQKLPKQLFHVNEIDDLIDIRLDYVRWVMDTSGNCFSLCNYPFIFNASSKTLLLQTDQGLQMHQAMQNAVNANFFAMLRSDMAVSQFIVLNVTRDNIVQDTLRELAQYTANDLKKPLKVRFHGEEAEDAGGVRKEFFMLLLKDVIDPKYGMFKTYEDSRAIWFTEDFFDSEDNMFALIGILCGLAIYNFTIINLPFPLALYKKLLGEEVDLSDLKELMPTVANSMQSILDYSEPDLEEVFNLTFSTSRDYFGEMQTIELKPGGESIQVTQENKDEFVRLYVDYKLNKSVAKSFQQFYAGFMKVCGGRVLKLFEAQELMAVVIGNEEYDWLALEEQAEYKNGYKSSDQTIRWFWEVFHELPLEEKKNFLLFLTGCDRIPIQGMKAIKIYIQPTNDEKFLPVAHTCFNLLDLPQYQTKERLKYKLLQAIQQTQGFSLV